MLLTNRINAINAQVVAYQEQIAELQAKITTLQSHAQEVQGVEQAAESALSQIEAAINMLQVVCPEEIATFKAAIDSKFNVLPTIAPAAPLTPPNEPEAVEAIATKITEPQVESTVDVTSTVEPEATEEAQATDATKTDAPTDDNGNGNDDNGNGNGSNGHNGHLLTYKDLDKVDRATLVKLADKHGIAYTTKTKKYELATALAGMVTQAEVDAARQ